VTDTAAPSACRVCAPEAEAATCGPRQRRARAGQQERRADKVMRSSHRREGPQTVAELIQGTGPNPKDGQSSQFSGRCRQARSSAPRQACTGSRRRSAPTPSPKPPRHHPPAYARGMDAAHRSMAGKPSFLERRGRMVRTPHHPEHTDPADVVGRFQGTGGCTKRKRQAKQRSLRRDFSCAPL